jgi:5-aminolevulinate synthase/8-amino-7-oxononanoate synthase
MSVIKKWGFAEATSAAAEVGLTYENIPTLDGANDALVSMAGRQFANFASIDFLGWQHDQDVLVRFLRAAADFGLVTGGSRATQGVLRPHREVEELLCEITGKEAAITFASGLLANIGFGNAMTLQFRVSDSVGVDNGDAVFVLDQNVHWSMWKSVEKLPWGRQLFTFRHNDVADLAAVLATIEAEHVVVGFETVYSADGSVAPVGRILDLCERHGAVSYADDANGFLVYNPVSGPFAQEYRELERATFVMTSFSKAVGLEGGAIAGPADAVHAFELLSGTSMFTAAIQPPTASAIAFVMRRILADPQLVAGYLDRVAAFRSRLADIGCTLNPTPSYITSILIGDDDLAEQVRRDFLASGFLVPVFRYPAVSRGKAVIRLILNARHPPAAVDGFVDTLAGLKRRYGF